MKGIRLLGRFHREADGAAIAMASLFAIDGRGDGKRARRVAVEITVLVGKPGLDAQRAQQRVVKGFGSFEVVNAEHDVTEHIYIRLNAFVDE